MTTKSPRTRRNAKKIDRAKVVELHQKGLNTVEIAQHQGCAPSTIWRFLQQTEPQRQALEQFKAGRADVLARLHAKAVDLKEKVIDSIDDAVVSTLKPGQKTGLLVALNLVAGTAFDKERLERGQSTANHSILTKVLNGALKDLYRPQHVVSGSNNSVTISDQTQKQAGTSQEHETVQDGAS